MDIREALKKGLVVEVENDLYMLNDGRVVKYDRYIKGACKWICDDGYAYRNFCEVFNSSVSFAKEHNMKVA